MPTHPTADAVGSPGWARGQCGTGHVVSPEMSGENSQEDAEAPDSSRSRLAGLGTLKGKTRGVTLPWRLELLVPPNAGDLGCEVGVFDLLDNQPIVAVVAPNYCSCRSRFSASTRAFAITLASVTSAPCWRLLSSAAAMKA
jgi:hypothetical protein